MRVTGHAVSQYKERFGVNNRTTSGQRIRQHIKNQINNHERSRRFNNAGTVTIVTDEFQAVWHRGRIVTVMYRHDDPRCKKEVV
jgi:hypothetical protein